MDWYKSPRASDLQAFQKVVRMQQVIADGLEIIPLSYGNLLMIKLYGHTNRNAMALGDTVLDNGSYGYIIDEKSRRDQLKHTEELDTEALELSDVEEAEEFMSDSKGEGIDNSD